jgi:quinol-cytochrome oxidoreductase complex cytochrome b subunit
MAGLLFLLIVTGTALRYDQEGFEALAPFLAGGELTGALGAFFTEGFTRSTPLLARVFSLHTSLLPLTLLALMAVHFWLVRQHGIHADASETIVFRRHAVHLAGSALMAFAFIGILAVVFPAGLGYPPVAGYEVTKPFWLVLWVYGLENLLGAWGMVVGPAVLFAFLVGVPLLDRRTDDTTGGHGWVGWAGLIIAVAVLLSGSMASSARRNNTLECDAHLRGRTVMRTADSTSRLRMSGIALLTALAVASSDALAHEKAVLRSTQSSVTAGGGLQLSGADLSQGVPYRLQLLGALREYELQRIDGGPD